MPFNHGSLQLTSAKPIVYTALSKHLFYFREHISSYVLNNGAVPLNPFMIFSYFLNDTVRRDDIRSANNTLVQTSDEVWVFGAISDGVLSEIIQAKHQSKPIRYYQVQDAKRIYPSCKRCVSFESGLEKYRKDL